jgi:hypothetical protein
MAGSYKENFQLATKLIADHQKAYESIDGFYRRAAVTASHKLNREVSEYDIVMIEMSVVESKIALNKEDIESYARLAVLASLAAQFALIKSENYKATNLVDVHESIRQRLEAELTDSAAVMAEKLAPLSSEAEFEEPDFKWLKREEEESGKGK